MPFLKRFKHWSALLVFAYGLPLCAQDVLKADSIEQSVTLQELIVTAPVIERSSSKVTYRVTNEMSRQPLDALQLLGILPEVSFSEVDRIVRVRMNKQVLIMVDGVPRSKDYISGLDTRKIDKIDVCFIVPTKYDRRKYSYCINYRTKRDLAYHQISAHNFCMISPNHNGDDVVANEQPQVRYLLSNKEWDLSASYGYADIHWNYPINRSMSIPGDGERTSFPADTKSPNENHLYQAHQTALGLNYFFAPGSIISWQTSYTHERENSGTHISYVSSGHKLSPEENHSLRNEFSPHDLNSSLIYQGTFGQKSSLYAALGYDRSWGRQSYLTSIGKESATSSFDWIKQQVLHQAELNVSASSNLLVRAGYQGQNLYYKRRMDDSKETDRQETESRYRIYGGATYTPLETLSITCVMGLEGVLRHGMGSKKGDWLPVPEVTIGWMPAKSISLALSYSSFRTSPMLYQILGVEYAVDDYVTHRGNPSLTGSRVHDFSLQTSLWSRVALGYSMRRDRGAVSEIFLRGEGDRIVRTFTNTDVGEDIIFAAYSDRIGKNLQYQLMGQYLLNSISSTTIDRKNRFNFAVDASLRYLIPSYSLSVGVAYKRYLKTLPTLQGTKDMGQDYWEASLQKSMLKNKLLLSLNYLPPIRIGTRQLLTDEVQTDFYGQRQTQDLRTYDHMVMIRLRYRLDFGKDQKRRHTMPSLDYHKEKKPDRGLL